LGQGLPIGVGMALALRHKQSKAFVYNSMSDGELDEGSTWEAAMSAAHHGLGNLICLVDINNQQADGPSTKILGFEPLADKWLAFGWHVQRVDGNDMAAVLQAQLGGAQTTGHLVQHADGQGRSIFGDSRQEPLHSRGPAGMAEGHSNT
jgi:transketolase N-terminal domain/subunit